MKTRNSTPQSEIKKIYLSFLKEKNEKFDKIKSEYIVPFYTFYEKDKTSNDWNYSFEQLSTFFNVTKNIFVGRVKRNEKKKKKVTTKKGRSSILTLEEENLLKNTIKEQYNTQNPMTRDDIIYFIKNSIKKEVCDNWVDQWIKKSDGYEKRNAFALEKERAELSKEELKKYFEDLEKSIIGVNPRMVLNFDESWEFNRTKETKRRVIVPKVESKKNFYKEHLPSGHITIAPIITLFGELVHRIIIIKNKTIEAKLIDYGVPSDEYCTIFYSDSGYINEDIFSQVLKKIIGPWAETMNKKGFKKGLLLLDGATAHNNTYLEKFGINNFFFPPHSSHLLQPLDASIFSSMKYYKKKFTKKEELSEHSNRVLSLLFGIDKAATKFAVIGCFKKVGIENDLTPKAEKAIIKKDNVLMLEGAKTLPEFKKKRKRSKVIISKTKNKKNEKKSKENEKQIKKKNKKNKSQDNVTTGIKIRIKVPKKNN
jgi:hypothetical protein